MIAGSQVSKLALASLVVLICSGCAGVGDGKTTIKPSPMSSFSKDANAEEGTRNNPIPLGKSVVVNNWEVIVTSVNKDALEEVKKSDVYGSAPAANEQYLLLNVKATYIGEESGEPGSDLRFKIVGSSGNTFSNSCGFTSDTFGQNGETFPGATVRGNFCFTVDVNQITGATVSIQGDYSTEDRKFVSID